MSIRVDLARQLWLASFLEVVPQIKTPRVDWTLKLWLATFLEVVPQIKTPRVDRTLNPTQTGLFAHNITEGGGGGQRKFFNFQPCDFKLSTILL